MLRLLLFYVPSTNILRLVTLHLTFIINLLQNNIQKVHSSQTNAKEQLGTVVYLHYSLVHTDIEKTCTIETTVKHIHDTRVSLNQEALGV